MRKSLGCNLIKVKYMCYGDVYELQYGGKILCVSHEKGLSLLKFARALDLPAYRENGKVCINTQFVGDDCTGTAELAKLYESLAVLDNITSTTPDYPVTPFSTHYCAYTAEDVEIVLNMSEPLGLTPTSVKNSTHIPNEGVCVTMYYHCNTRWSFNDLTNLFTRTGKKAVELVAGLRETIHTLREETASLHATQETLQGKLNEQSQANTQRTAQFEKQSQEDNMKTDKRLDSLEQWKSESDTKQSSRIADLESKLAQASKCESQRQTDHSETQRQIESLEATVKSLQSQIADLSEGCKKTGYVSHASSPHTEHQSDNGASFTHEQHGETPVPPAGVVQEQANVLNG